MAFIDERGRLFGRINVFDAAVVAGVVATLALAVVGYRLLRLPLPPRVTEVSPSTLTSGPSLRMTIKGENLLPYMRVYLQRTGEPAKVMYDASQWIKVDSYTLANAARTTFLVESPTLAEVEVPNILLPGTYDMVFNDETKVVGVARAAFTVVPAPKLKVESRYREAMLRVTGAFIGMSQADAAAVKAGAKVPTGAEDPWGEVLSTGSPQKDVATVETGRGPIEVGVLDRWRVAADIRFRCVATQGKCFSMEMPLLVGDTLNLQVDGAVRNFLIEKVSPEPPAAR
jgi:Domain of unknown function (DUF4330)